VMRCVTHVYVCMQTWAGEDKVEMMGRLVVVHCLDWFRVVAGWREAQRVAK